MAEIEPSTTVYVRDLNDKARKSEMKQALYILFSNYGPIIDLTLLKTQKLRGQAFVVFANLSSAANAIEGLQQFMLFGKNMTLEYARKRTEPKEKAPSKPEDETAEATEQGEEMAVEPQPKVEVKPVKTHTRSNKPDQPAATGKAPPNKVLFIQSLPSDITAEQLETIFSTCSGYKEVRVAPGNRGLAFVEFNNERDSALAMNKYQGHTLGEKNMYISFQKKID